MSVSEFVGWFLIGCARDALRRDISDEQVAVVDGFMWTHSLWRVFRGES